MNEEVKELQKGISEIATAIARIEEQLKQLASTTLKADNATIAIAQMQRDLTTAFKRVDASDDRMDAIELQMMNDKRDARQDKKWLIGTVIATATFLWQYLKSGGGK